MAKDMTVALLFDFYGEMLTDKQRQVFQLYYEDDLSLSEIAENQAITRQGVRDAIKRAEQQMLDMEARLGLARRFREMQQGFAQILTAAEEIRLLNDRYGYSREIEERSRKIEALATDLGER